MRKIKFLSILALSLFAFSFTPKLAFAQPAPTDPCDGNKDGVVSTQESLKCGSNSGAGASNKDPNSVNDTLRRVINILSVFAGAIAVIMIIVGGFRYVTSAGNPESAKSAKNIIVYALIGLVIVVMSQMMVRFVLRETTRLPGCVGGKYESGHPQEGQDC